MNCSHPFTNIWVLRTFGKSYWNKFKNAKVENTFSTEVSWIPGDMDEIAYSKWHDGYMEIKVKRNKVSGNRWDYQRILRHLDTIKKNNVPTRGIPNTIINHINAEIDALNEMYDNLSIEIGEKKKTEPVRVKSSTSTKKYTVKYKCSMCPNGLINEYGKCPVCDNKTCRSCLKHRVEGHECDPNDVETVKQIKKDSKSCPKCHVLIHRTAGCSQMWCPQCNTVFDWNTGAIQVGGWIHNPDYIQARSNGGAVPRHLQDVRCGGYDYKSVRDIMSSRCYTFAGHVDDIRSFKLDHTSRTNKKSRFEFVKNNITEKRFKSEIKKSVGTIIYHRDIRTILQCCIENIHETGLAYVNKQIDSETARKQINGNRDLTNELFKEASELHGRGMFILKKDYTLNFGKGTFY